MGRRFTALESFSSKETRSEYVEGMSYEVQDEDDEDLMELIDQWVEEGKVREGGKGPELFGEGVVDDNDEPKGKA